MPVPLAILHFCYYCSTRVCFYLFSHFLAPDANAPSLSRALARSFYAIYSPPTPIVFFSYIGLLFRKLHATTYFAVCLRLLTRAVYLATDLPTYVMFQPTDPPTFTDSPFPHHPSYRSNTSIHSITVYDQTYFVPNRYPSPELFVIHFTHLICVVFAKNATKTPNCIY